MVSKAFVLLSVILVASFLLFAEVAQGIQIPRKLNLEGLHFPSSPKAPSLQTSLPRGPTSPSGPSSTTSVFCGSNRQCSCNGCSHGLDIPVEDKVEP
ncbi:hypothetical protein QJS10_CPA09g01988 [Acorus calamus]|uniref:Uncharacterized protein n=1 Tax=Acorus calamus TaxID=4465 RepID=A0AAV9E4F7_ACOCL|nr:hypothetical protein QJS10_CPA09g01988 [Acorus calamus]